MSICRREVFFSGPPRGGGGKRGNLPQAPRGGPKICKRGAPKGVMKKNYLERFLYK
jgi:hypothetical protein